MKSLILLAFSCIVTVSCQTDSYTHNTFLDASEKYQIFWKFNENEITFEVQVETTGYVGLGFSPTGEMLQSDIVIGWVKDGETFLQDRFAEKDDFEPMIDYQNDYNIILGQENGTHTILVFSRKFETCDDLDRKLTEGTIRVIWSYHADDPETDAELPYHGANRGSKSIYLFDPPAVVSDLPENFSTFEFLNENVSVPSNQDTTYWCQAFKMPDLGGMKHHMIKVEPLIQKGHESLVHHIIVYQCHQEVNESHDGYGYECYHPNMPEDLKSCSTIFIAWAIGSEGFDFPENVGFPMEEGNGLDFAVLETHYDNPQFRTDYIDSSGIKIYYTTELRENDAGILTTGVSVSNQQAIPPASSEFISTAYCPQDYVSQALNDTEAEVTIFSTLLHAHLVGISLSTRLFRDGKEHAVITQDNFYDFNYQEFRMLPNNLIMTSADTIITQCKYATKDTTEVTYGGLGTQQEMCLAFLYYYPELPFKTCVSMVPHEKTLASIIGESVEGAFNSEGAFVITSPEEYVNVTYTQVLDETDWTDEARQALQEVQTTATSYIYSDVNGIISFDLFEPFAVNDPFMEELSEECISASAGIRLMVPYIFIMIYSCISLLNLF